jgi:hypothetical protein
MSPVQNVNLEGAALDGNSRRLPSHRWNIVLLTNTSDLAPPAPHRVRAGLDRLPQRHVAPLELLLGARCSLPRGGKREWGVQSVHRRGMQRMPVGRPLPQVQERRARLGRWEDTARLAARPRHATDHARTEAPSPGQDPMHEGKRQDRHAACPGSISYEPRGRPLRPGAPLPWAWGPARRARSRPQPRASAAAQTCGGAPCARAGAACG